MKKLYLSLGVLFFTHFYTQNIKWEKRIQTNSQDLLSGLISTLDGQYLVFGSSIQANSPTTDSQKSKGYDYHLVKLDQQGQQLWEKYYSGDKHDYLISGISTQEGGFLLAGTSYSSLADDKKQDSKGSSDIWIVRLDENGKELWQKTLGTPAFDEAKSVIQTVDQGFVVAGSTTQTKLGYGSKDVLITKLDKTGKIVNQILLGGKGFDETERIIPTKDGGALIGIYSRSGIYDGKAKDKMDSKVFMSYDKDINEEHLKDLEHLPESANNQNNSKTTNASDQEDHYDIRFHGKSVENYGEGDYWIVKLDINGNIQWEKTFGGKQDDHIRTLALTDSGYIIGGGSRSEASGNKRTKLEEGTDLWILALDENGNEEWQHSYNFKNRDVLMSLNAITYNTNNQNTTKGFLLGGYTQATGEAQKDDETFWMLYVDRTGKEQWRKYVEGKEKLQNERLVSADLNRDGSYILAGTSAEELGKEHWKIVKLLDSDVQNLIDKKDIQIYPNPVKDYCYVEIGLDFEQADIKLYDMTGRLVQSITTKNRVTKLNTASLTQGVYVVTTTAQNKKLNAKIIKQ